MSDTESRTQSFVIRIWAEERDAGSDRVLWRGHITHVPSKERRYFDDLSGLIRFVAPYLEQIAIDAEEDRS